MSPGDLAVKACKCVLQYDFTFHITNPKHLVPVVHRIASTTHQINHYLYLEQSIYRYYSHTSLQWTPGGRRKRPL